MGQSTAITDSGSSDRSKEKDINQKVYASTSRDRLLATVWDVLQTEIMSNSRRVCVPMTATMVDLRKFFSQTKKKYKIRDEENHMQSEKNSKETRKDILVVLHVHHNYKVRGSSSDISKTLMNLPDDVEGPERTYISSGRTWTDPYAKPHARCC